MAIPLFMASYIPLSDSLIHFMRPLNISGHNRYLHFEKHNILQIILRINNQRIEELGFVGLPGVGRKLREGVTEDGTVVLEFLAFSGLDCVEFLTIRNQSL